jgi:UDP-N-acetylmuramoyl-L-alanyl-D-glutamate--2,6-diaminopimelate ligase
LHVTSPHSTLIQRLLKQSADAGDEYFVLETTSHAIDQYRDGGVQYEVGLITNITHEHLDYHKTYDNYVRTKAKLALRAKKAIINRDDESYFPLKNILSAHNKSIITFGLKDMADYKLDITTKIDRDLPEFNKYNFLAAYAVCRELNIDEEYIFKAMETFVSPVGRMETVYEGDFKVIVDFAHTPNAIKEALQAVKKSMKGGRLIHIFGCAGRRDHTKRPLMGEMSAKYADLTIITEEDYRTEDPQEIAMEIAQGLDKGGFKYVEFDTKLDEDNIYTINNSRGEAIKKALEIVKKGDIIILTGKGHEKSLARGTKEYSWSDQEEVRKLLKI